MRLDPKYFNLFILTCAILAIAVIVYSSVSYHQKQSETMLESIEQRNLGDYYLTYIEEADSIRIDEFKGSSVIIDFWATWSGRSQNNHELLEELSKEYPGLVVIAAVVRDDDDMAKNYAGENRYDFIYVQGTSLYHELKVPGVPAQILIDKNGRFYDFQVGEDPDRLRQKIRSLVTQ